MTKKKDDFEIPTVSGNEVESRSQEFTESFQQGTRLLHQGQAKEAIPYLDKAHALQPGDLDTAINLSGAYIMTRKFKKAEAILEPLSEQYPSHAKIWINLGAAYLGNPVLARSAEQERAIFAFEQALKVDPIAPSVAYNIGLIYRDREDADQAAYWFKQAIKHNPNDKDARSLLGRLESA